MVKGISLPDIKIYYEVIIIKTCGSDADLDKQIKGRELKVQKQLCTYIYMIKAALEVSEERVYYSIDCWRQLTIHIR